MKTKIISMGYKTESMMVDSKNIDNFEIIETRRQISDRHVSNIATAFGRGDNPIGVIIINKIRGKMRLIDGNHRIEALRRFLNRKTEEGKKVEVTLKVHENLTEEEEREIYTKEAKRRNESYEDRLNMYKETIQFWKSLQDMSNGFPCKVTIYTSRESIRLRMLLNGLYVVKNSSRKGFLPRYPNKENIVEFAQSLMYDEFTFAKEFMVFFQKTFGQVESKNMYLKGHFFMPIMDIYAKNYSRRNDKSFKERFRRIIARTKLFNLVNR